MTAGGAAARPTRSAPNAILPDFPWDTIAAARARAASHPDGIVDLSVGTPVDPVDPLIRAALATAAEVSGYPATHGTAALRQAAVDALARRHGVSGLDPAAVLPVIGTKELIASLPRLLGLGADDTVVVPELAYPTYEVGALLTGSPSVRSDAPAGTPALIYLNTPSNPTGRVLEVDQLRAVVAFAREVGAVVACDECYLGLSWEQPAVSILDPRVCEGDHTGVLALHSLSKTSNVASYRAGFVTGDPALVQALLQVRRHTGMMVPYPVQAAMTAALNDDEHAQRQRQRYADRRTVLRNALQQAGFRIDLSQAGLYLWSTRDEEARATLDWLAHRGILVAPGDFYGPSGARHVRVALTATDERIAAAATRLAA